MTKSKKLNLGCGTDIMDGWVNLDRCNVPGVNIVHDLDILPLPFKKDEFEFILCNDVFEHVNYIPLLKELYRILKSGGTLQIKVPHFSSVDNYIDPTHVNQFSFRTFEYFLPDNKRNFYFDYSFKKINYSRITFRKKYYLFNFLVDPLVNSCRAAKIIYEGSFISSLFPAHNIIVKFVK